MTTESPHATDLFGDVTDALNDRDFDRFVELHADDVVVHDHDETLHGVEAAKQQEQRLFAAFPDMHYDVSSVVADGDQVAARWTVTGTHKGEFQGLPSTGKAVEIPAMGAMRVENGRFSEVWLVYDRLGLMEQLCALEPPAV
jgi:steroid delta-isomerase-like uncharacterized protein